jgi:hypothetical protein
VGSVGLASQQGFFAQLDLRLVLCVGHKGDIASQSTPQVTTVHSSRTEVERVPQV